MTIDRAALERELAELEARAEMLRGVLEEPPSQQDVAYPEIVVPLTGENGNAFAILGRVLNALRRAGVDEHQRDAFHTEATSGDYDHLIQTVMEWVSVY